MSKPHKIAIVKSTQRDREMLLDIADMYLPKDPALSTAPAMTDREEDRRRSDQPGPE